MYADIQSIVLLVFIKLKIHLLCLGQESSEKSFHKSFLSYDKKARF